MVGTLHGTIPGGDAASHGTHYGAPVKVVHIDLSQPVETCDTAVISDSIFSTSFN